MKMNQGVEMARRTGVGTRSSSQNARREEAGGAGRTSKVGGRQLHERKSADAYERGKEEETKRGERKEMSRDEERDEKDGER
ncbi:hypothetical protein AB1N83_012760 [Pleurotus pulmonarius]